MKVLELKDFDFKVKKKREYRERKLQKEFFKYIRLAYPRLAKNCFSIMNEGKREVWYGRQLKLAGMVSGVPDIFCAFPSRKDLVTYYGLFIELKDKGEKASKNQLEFIENVKEMGYEAIVVDNLDDAIWEFRAYAIGFNWGMT